MGRRRRIQEQYTTLRRGYLFHPRFGATTFPDNGQASSLLKQSYQRLPQKAVFGYQEDLHRTSSYFVLGILHARPNPEHKLRGIANQDNSPSLKGFLSKRIILGCEYPLGQLIFTGKCLIIIFLSPLSSNAKMSACVRFGRVRACTAERENFSSD